MFPLYSDLSSVISMHIQSHFVCMIYINDLSEGITSNIKLLAGDSSIFSTIYNINTSASNLNSDLQKVSEWTFKLKMFF